MYQTYRNDSTLAMSHIRAVSEIALAVDEPESMKILAVLMDTVNVITERLRGPDSVPVSDGRAHGQAA